MSSSLKVNNTRITANSIEPRAAIGQYHPDSDSYTLLFDVAEPAWHALAPSPAMC